MKRKAAIFAAALVSVFSPLAAGSCGGLRDGVESPVREATQQVQEARDVQQQVEEVQQQRQQLEEVQ